MDFEKINKISQWIAEAVSPDSKVSTLDQLAISMAFMRAIEEVEPIYEKYQKTKRKTKKNTANLLGNEFAGEVFKGMMMFSDLMKDDEK